MVMMTTLFLYLNLITQLHAKNVIFFHDDDAQRGHGIPKIVVELPVFVLDLMENFTWQMRRSEFLKLMLTQVNFLGILNLSKCACMISIWKLNYEDPSEP